MLLFTALSYSEVVDSVKTDAGEARAGCLLQLFRKRGWGELLPLQALYSIELSQCRALFKSWVGLEGFQNVPISHDYIFPDTYCFS